MKAYTTEHYMTFLFITQGQESLLNPHTTLLRIFNEIKDTELKGFDTTNMKIKDWYKFLTEKYITHETNKEEFDLKPTKTEIFSPHIDHKNSYFNIRKLGLPSKIMLTLFMLKNDLFLTED